MINWKQFVTAALTPNKEAFVIYVAYLRARMFIHIAWKAQMALLLAQKVCVLKEYYVFFKALQE